MNKNVNMKIFFFGDSICHGQFVSPHKTWVSRISAELSQLDPAVLILNPSHSGDTTRMALEKMPFDVQQHGIDIMFIQFGINDSNFWLSDNGLPRVSKMAFEANLFEIVERAVRFGAKRIFLNTNHPLNKIVVLGNGKKIQLQDETTKYNKLIVKVASKLKNVRLVDIEKEFYKRINKGKTVNYYLLEDGVHLNDNGHDLYFEIILPIFKNIFASSNKKI